MTRVSLQDVAKYEFGRLAILGYESGGRFLNTAEVRIRQSSSLIGHSRIRVLFKVDQHVAIREPCGLERRRSGDDPLKFLACRPQPSGSAIGARKVGARLPELRGGGNRAFESLDSGRYLVLIEQSDPEQPHAIDVAGSPGLNGAQLPLGGRGAPRAQLRQRLSVRGPQFCLRSVLHGIFRVQPAMASGSPLTRCCARWSPILRSALGGYPNCMR